MTASSSSSWSRTAEPVLDDTVLSVLARLEEEDAREEVEGIPFGRRSLACGPEAGRLLLALVATARGPRVLEIGGSRGYSTIWLAAAARIAGGSVVSLEQDPDKVAAWRANIDEAGLTEHAVVVEGAALDALARIEERFQIVFIDAWKEDYELYFTAVRTLVEPGAVVVADNVLSHSALASYVARRQADPTVTSVTLPIGNGLEVTTILRP